MLVSILLLLLQGVPVPASQSGTISGVLTSSAGKPAAGIRVSALARPDSALDALMASALVSIAETNEDGSFRLENVPPGRYYVVAGRMDQPTYYPGTLDMAAGKEIQITPGAALTGMNFVLRDNSLGRADLSFAPAVILPSGWTVPLRVILEGGGKIPIRDGGLAPVVLLTRHSDGNRIEVPLSASQVHIPLSASLDYRVSVVELSRRYRVKSIRWDQTNLETDLLKLPAIVAPPAGASFQVVIQLQGQAAQASTISPAIEITLEELPAARRTGATLSGTLNRPVPWNLTAAEIAGSIYQDGTFEVKNVPPGRHMIFTANVPLEARPLAAPVLVGDADVSGIQLRPILEIPRDWNATDSTTAAGGLRPEALKSLVDVRGRLIDESTGTVFQAGRPLGRITINGNSISYTINDRGEFEIQNLLPGRYDLELWIFGGETYSSTLEVGGENVDLEWPVSIRNE